MNKSLTEAIIAAISISGVIGRDSTQAAIELGTSVYTDEFRSDDAETNIYEQNTNY